MLYNVRRFDSDLSLTFPDTCSTSRSFSMLSPGGLFVSKLIVCHRLRLTGDVGLGGGWVVQLEQMANNVIRHSIKDKNSRLTTVFGLCFVYSALVPQVVSLA